jgi:predicted nucleic acid-binding protein
VPNPLLLDTDVLVDYSRHRPEAVRFMRSLSQRPMISAITVAELYAGVRDGEERAALDAFVSRSVVVPVDTQVAERGGLIQRQYHPSHGVGLADAIIAATVQIERCRFASLNIKHFPMLQDVLVPYLKT